VRTELDELRRLIRDQAPTTISSSSLDSSSMMPVPIPVTVPSMLSGVTPVISDPSSSTPANGITSAVLTSSSSSPAVDPQSQAMLLTAESLSKLSMVVTSDKSTDTKVEWPKFSGNAKRFRAW